MRPQLSHPQVTLGSAPCKPHRSVQPLPDKWEAKAQRVRPKCRGVTRGTLAFSPRGYGGAEEKFVKLSSDNSERMAPPVGAVWEGEGQPSQGAPPCTSWNCLWRQGQGVMPEAQAKQAPRTAFRSGTSTMQPQEVASGWEAVRGLRPGEKRVMERTPGEKCQQRLTLQEPPGKPAPPPPLPTPWTGPECQNLRRLWGSCCPWSAWD